MQERQERQKCACVSKERKRTMQAQEGARGGGKVVIMMTMITMMVMKACNRCESSIWWWCVTKQVVKELHASIPCNCHQLEIQSSCV